MRYDIEYVGRPRARYRRERGRGEYGPARPPRGSRRHATEAQHRRRELVASEWLPPPDRRRPFRFEGPGYAGPGELGRYGRAPVPYGPDHTYDYHLGDRYGYGPDFVRGEERIRRRRLPELRRRRPRR